jgi:hypothetical protein
MPLLVLLSASVSLPQAGFSQEPTGACCSSPTGSCVVTTRAICEAGGRTYMGDGTDCDPNPCVATTGACCFPDSTCEVLAIGDCAANGGVFQGPDTTCDTPCNPVGACCLWGNLCVIAEEANCIAGDGVYMGHGTDCEPDPCSPAGVSSSSNAPEKFRLYGPSPNPTAGAVRFHFELLSASHATVRIIDVSGKVISVPIDEDFPSGFFSFSWNPLRAVRDGLPSGIYFLQLEVGGLHETRRIVFLR